MIDLNINRKTGEIIPAIGRKVRESSRYSPDLSKKFKLSRSRFSDFLSCKRCFYMDVVLGFASPGIPAFSLNALTDTLLKKEFDLCREKQKPHKLCIENGLSNLVPFQHPDIDKWRDSLHHGIQLPVKNSNIILTGGVDDIWEDQNNNELVVVDYKSQAKKYDPNPLTYFNDVYHFGYKLQLDFYAYLLVSLGYKVSQISYLLVCNADGNADGFNGELKFSQTLIPYEWDILKIPEQVSEMIDCINQITVPKRNPGCKNCAYSIRRSSFDHEHLGEIQERDIPKQNTLF